MMVLIKKGNDIMSNEIMNVNLQFYPTPNEVIAKMILKVSSKITTLGSLILDPSAGEGAILDYLKNREIPEYSKFENGKIVHRTVRHSINLYAIELDPTRFKRVASGGYKMLGYDFLNWGGLERFDVIVMNPPFKYGCEHLNKALDCLNDRGEVVCLLNAETIRNPYSIQRKALLARLESMGATFEYLTGAFIDAENTTGIDTVIVHAINNTPMPDKPNLFDDMETENDLNYKVYENGAELVNPKTPIDNLIMQYEYEKLNGLKVFEFMYKTPSSFLKLNMDLIEYSKQLKVKYWHEVLNVGMFAKKLTSKQHELLHNQIERMQNVEFNLTNINAIIDSVLVDAQQALKDSALNMFNDFSKYDYNDYKDNIYLYNGWKTNSAFKINKKIILPFYNSDTYLDYKAVRMFNDIYKVLKMFTSDTTVFSKDDGTNQPITTWGDYLAHRFSKNTQYELIDLGLITVRFYKKGTVHIVFKDNDMLHRFNAYCCIEKNWLPHDYGRKSKKDMTPEELEVVNAFGEYLYGQPLMLTNN